MCNSRSPTVPGPVACKKGFRISAERTGFRASIASGRVRSHDRSRDCRSASTFACWFRCVSCLSSQARACAIPRPRTRCARVAPRRRRSPPRPSADRASARFADTRRNGQFRRAPAHARLVLNAWIRKQHAKTNSLYHLCDFGFPDKRARPDRHFFISSRPRVAVAFGDQTPSYT